MPLYTPEKDKYVVKKGDYSLNSIVRRKGYKNYRDAGITSVPSGNFDLIRPGDVIEFNGSSNQGISEFRSPTPVVSSLDSRSTFDKSNAELDKALGVEPDENYNQEREERLERRRYEREERKREEQYDAYREAVEDQKELAIEESNEVYAEYQKLYDIQLAAIDKRTKSLVNQLDQTFEQRLDEQVKINTLRVDRTKAYGLAYGSARLTPIDWSDSITNREQEAADEIKGLELERQNLIDQAQAAKEDGDARLLAQKIQDYSDIKRTLNARLQEIEAESLRQFQLLREVRLEDEAEFKREKDEALEKLKTYYKLNPEQVKGMTPEKKEELVNKLTERYGFQNFEALSAINSALQEDFEDLQSQADIKKTEAQTKQATASAEAAYALARKRDAERKEIQEGGDRKTYTQSELNKLRQAGLEDAPQNVQDDYLYGETEDDESKLEIPSVKAYLEGKKKASGSDTVDNTDPNDPHDIRKYY